MRVVVIEPAGPVVSLAEAKLQLWIDADDTSKDGMIQPMIDAATALIDGPAGWLGRALGVQTLEARMSHFPGGCSNGLFDGWGYEAAYGFGDRHHHQAIVLPYPPIASITSVTYIDQSGAAQTLDPAAYVLDEDRLLPVPGTTWPSVVRIQADGVRIRYLAGYAGSDGSQAPIPAPVKQAILMTVASLYDNRDSASASIAGATTTMLAPYRVIG